MIDLGTIIQKTVLKCGGCFAVIVVNTGLVTFGLCTECFGKLPAERADTVLMIGEKLIFSAVCCNSLWSSWQAYWVLYFLSDFTCYILYITIQ